jgi:hypothetical protein
MIHYFYRRIISDGRRREKKGVSLSLGSSDTQVRHAGDEFADFGGARAAGRFSSKGDPKNSSGAKPFSHAGAPAAPSLESMVAAKFAGH